MGRRRQHVNPLGLGVAGFGGRVPELPPGRPVEVEIGCADAQFLFERAAREPGRLYLGLEIRGGLVDEVNRRAADENLPVEAVRCHANLHLEQILPPARIARVYVNFPDPWFKRRHRKRRLMDADLGRAIHRVLEPGGQLLFQSDVWDVALDAMAVLDGLDELYQNLAGPWSFWREPQPFGARSWREEHCQAEGLPIWRLLYRTLSS